VFVDAYLTKILCDIIIHQKERFVVAKRILTRENLNLNLLGSTSMYHYE
jgi:hypothetical protein